MAVSVEVHQAWPARRTMARRTITRTPRGIAMALDAREAYGELIRGAQQLGLLASCSAVLGWDEQTYMPTGGSAHRGEQMALLAGLHHERATDPLARRFAGDRRELRPGDRPGLSAAANIRELRRSYDRRVRLPRDLVEALARTTSLAQQEWISARRRR